jgi:cell division septum initiation protein DivIVA
LNASLYTSAQELLSRAEGQSQAIINAATAEARAVKEIARSIAASGENPAKYATLDFSTLPSLYFCNTLAGTCWR